MDNLVSVITPIHRIQDVENALDNFLRQDYEHKELIVIPHGFEIASHQAWNRPEIIVGVRAAFDKMTIGAMRNYGCKLSAGSIIASFDSDDWYSNDWITRSVEALTTQNCDCVGLNRAVFHNVITGRKYLWHYDYEKTKGQPGGAGATLCYYRKAWERFPFPNIQTGEERTFMANLRFKKHDYMEGFEARITGSNTISHTQVSNMKPLP